MSKTPLNADIHVAGVREQKAACNLGCSYSQDKAALPCWTTSQMSAKSDTILLFLPLFFCVTELSVLALLKKITIEKGEPDPPIGSLK